MGEKTQIFELDIVKIAEINKKLTSSEKYKDQLTFLKNSIPGFDKVSAMAKARIARCLTER
jgi:hypothetical protein